MTTEPHWAWALPLAVERLNDEYEANNKRRNWANADNEHPTVITVAKLIAKYEQPPADPAEEAAVRFLNAWQNTTWSLQKWRSRSVIGFSRAAQAVHEILAEQVKP